MGVYTPNIKRPHCCRICPNPVCIPDGIHTLDALDFIMKRRHEHPDRRADDCPLEEIDIVRCGECKWWDNDGESPYGYCHAEKHCHFSNNWEISIYRKYKADHYCSDGERRE